MKNILTGHVSKTNNKTITVVVNTHKSHPVYKKRYLSTKKFLAHDEKNQSKPGDTVAIEESKPISKRKRFVLKDIIEHSGEEKPKPVKKAGSKQ